ncbi:hypothetical protein [Nannocystis pusilla]|uniref:hypothetical protein n=1 Tax=Nannocystis pusilla TaxID=889268 RepID=UPI003B79D62A
MPPLTVAQYEALVQATFGPLAAMVLAQYPAADYEGDGQAAYVALTSDLKFICGARRAARAADAGQDAPVFRYHFAYDGYDAQPNVETAAFHGLELIYIFAAWGRCCPSRCSTSRTRTTWRSLSGCRGVGPLRGDGRPGRRGPDLAGVRGRGRQRRAARRAAGSIQRRTHGAV